MLIAVLQSEALDPSKVPSWVSYAALGLGIFNLLVVAFPYLYYFLWRSATVTLRLTRDFFYRLIEDGVETYFVNGILVIEGAPIILKEASLKLEKLNPPTKQYDLKVINFGTKTQSIAMT